MFTPPCIRSLGRRRVASGSRNTKEKYLLGCSPVMTRTTSIPKPPFKGWEIHVRSVSQATTQVAPPIIRGAGPGRHIHYSCHPVIPSLESVYPAEDYAPSGNSTRQPCDFESGTKHWLPSIWQRSMGKLGRVECLHYVGQEVPDVV